MKNSQNAFQRWRALLKILEKDDYTNFLSSEEKTKRKILECFQKILEYRDSEIEGGICQLWLKPPVYSDEADEEYCKLIRFGGYEIIGDGDTILQSDMIILESYDSNQYILYYNYQNINRFCDYMQDVINAFEDEVCNIYDDIFQDEFNQKINKIIDYYCDFIDYDYYYGDE